MAKRIIGLFLALCLVVGLLPMIALAEEGEEVPAITATLAIATGNNDAPVEWKPALSEGMAAEYAKTTAEGNLVLEGASESDYNLKAEWPTGGKPTLTMKDATLTGENLYPNKKNIIQIGGSADFEILLKGTNTLNGHPARANAEDYKISAYKCPFGIAAYNTGTLTIKGENKANDKLAIHSWGGNGLDNRYNAVNIENVDFSIILYKDATASSYAAHALLMQYYADGYEDKTDLTVKNSNFTIDCNKNYGAYAIIFGKSGDSASATNTGDILFQNSVVSFNRKNSTGQKTALVRAGADTTITFDRCDVTTYSWRIMFDYVPTMLNYATASYREELTSSTYEDHDYDPAKAGTTMKVRWVKSTHACGTAVADDFDCTTVATCDVCGKALGTAQTAHTPAADDGDCTTAVMCANAGCQKVAIEAKAAHTPAADDGDCTTAISCTVCGKETTAAAATHTGGTATCTKKAVCTVCNKEYGELAPHTPAARPSCDVAANCTVCGQEALKAGQHAGGTATCQAKAKCTECGTEYGELAPCAGGTATCTKKAVCATCNKEYGELAAHTGGTATCKDKAVCTACNQPYGELLTTHTGGTATCKDKAVCTVCNKAYGELSKTHTPAADDGDCTTAVKCSVCGAETTAAKTHAFTSDKDASCDNAGCKHTRTLTTNPSTGDVSILLTAAVALTSAVGFAGVTILRKKEN